jgi:hypothetical protein
MDSALDQLLNLGTMIFAVSIVIATFFIRRIVETQWPSLRKKADENAPLITYSTRFARWYQTVILYAIPVVVGGLLGLLKITYFFPESVQTAEGRLFYGGVVGWFSSAIYKVVKKMLASKGIDLPGSLMPGPPSAPPTDPSPPFNS